MTIRENIINEYAMKGYLNADRCEADTLNRFVELGMKKYDSRMERNVCKNIEHYTDTDDDIVFYNKDKNSVIVANAKYNENKYINGYDTWILK